MTVRDKDIGKIKDLFTSRARLPCTGPSASGHIRPYPIISGPLVPFMGSRPITGTPRS